MVCPEDFTAMTLPRVLPGVEFQAFELPFVVHANAPQLGLESLLVGGVNPSEKY